MFGILPIDYPDSSCPSLGMLLHLYDDQPWANTASKLIAKGSPGASSCRVGDAVPQVAGRHPPIACHRMMRAWAAVGRSRDGRNAGCGSVSRLLDPCYWQSDVGRDDLHHDRGVRRQQDVSRDPFRDHLGPAQKHEIKPRVFFEDFPNRCVVGGRADAAVGASVLADTYKPDQPTVFTARPAAGDFRPRQAHRGQVLTGGRVTQRCCPIRPGTRSPASPS